MTHFKKKHIQLLFFFFICLNSFATSSDLLSEENTSSRTTTDRELIQTNLSLLLKSESFIAAVEIAKANLEKAKVINDSTQLAYAHYSIGYIQQLKGESSTAFTNILISHNIFRLLNDEFGTALCLDKLGLLFKEQGSYSESFKHHSAALTIFTKHNDTCGMIEAFRNIGVYYRQTNNYPKALASYKIALKLALIQNDNHLTSVLNSIGSYYWFKNNYDSAFYYYRRALSIKPNNLLTQARQSAVINNIGNVHRNMRNYDSALFYYDKAIKKSRAFNLNNLEGTNLKNFGVVYIQLSDFEKAQQMITESLKIAYQSNLKRIIQMDYLLLSELYQLKNDYKNALLNYQRYSQIKDSSLAEKQINLFKLNESQFNIEVAAKEKAIYLKEFAESKLAVEKQEKLKAIYAATFIVLLLLSGFILYLYRTTKTSKEKLQKLNLGLEEKVKDRTKHLVDEVEGHKLTGKKLLKAKEKAEESDQLKSAFLSNMSHEIRTPMNSIIGFSDLLLYEPLNTELKNKYIHIIQSNGNKLLKLIDDIIDIAKIEANQININNSSCNIDILLDDLFQMFAKQTGSELSLTVKKANKKLTIITDMLRLQQILSNLLSNAFKFTETGNIEFGYKLTEDNFIVFYVKDTGKGISKEGQEFIFERFRQENFNLAKIYEGTGLGLAICKNLVELFKGKIWVESELKKGSIFSFRIPLEIAKTKKQKQKSIEKINLKYNWADKVILVAEDNNESFELIKFILKLSNVEILRAKDGTEAVKICSNNSVIDLVLMDIQLPKMNGIAATKAIKKIKPKIPIIAITAFAFMDEKQKCLKAGCSDFIPKPISRTSLLNQVAKYLN